jgi:hypothetical protein
LDKPAGIENISNNKTQIWLIHYIATKTARKKLLWIISNPILKKPANFSAGLSGDEIIF